MTRDEYRKKSSALSNAGDATAKTGLLVLAELEAAEAAALAAAARQARDPREPEDLRFLKPVADFVAAFEGMYPNVKADARVFELIGCLSFGDLRRIADRYNHTATKMRERMVETAETAMVAAFAAGQFPEADPVAMGKGEAAPPAARNLENVQRLIEKNVADQNALNHSGAMAGGQEIDAPAKDGYGQPFGQDAVARHLKNVNATLTEHGIAPVSEYTPDPESPEAVAAAATRKANGMPEDMGTWESDKEKLPGNKERVPNGGTGEG